MEARQLFSNLHYYIKDYLGNVRCVVRHDGTLIESNEYYPYGGLSSATASAQPYKYGAKYAYDSAYKIDTTKHQDMIISKAFKKISDTPYDILSNNCATAVAKSLNKAGIITYMGNNTIWIIKLNSYIPSILFNDIVKHNSNGTYIYR